LIEAYYKTWLKFAIQEQIELTREWLRTNGTWTSSLFKSTLKTQWRAAVAQNEMP
jgi:hypothetical protein